MYQLRVSYRFHETDHTAAGDGIYGPLTHRHTAESVLEALARRDNVISVTIEQCDETEGQNQ